MKIFSDLRIIKESNVGPFFMSSHDINDRYKTLINKIINDILYKDRLLKTNTGQVFVTPLPFEDQTRYISIVNFINTNINTIKFIVRKYNITSVNHLLQFIEQNGERIFHQDSPDLASIVNILRRTENEGELTESFVINFLNELGRTKLKKVINASRTNTSSYEDLILGIDIIFKVDGKDFTVQVKPLKNHNIKGDIVEVETSGNIKPYKVDYMCFANRNTGKILLFQNKGIERIPRTNIVRIPKKYLKEMN